VPERLFDELMSLSPGASGAGGGARVATSENGRRQAKIKAKSKGEN